MITPNNSSCILSKVLGGGQDSPVSVGHRQIKRGQEVEACSGQVSAREEREDRMQQDAQAKAAKHHPEINKDEKRTGGSRMLMARQVSVSKRLTKKEKTGCSRI